MDTRLNIMVVEDNDDLREATLEALQAMGHTVRAVDCAETLDDELGQFQADLLVLDLNLPGEDGLSVAQRLRVANPDIGIIMVTARDQVRDVATGYGAGADIYLAKPTSFEALGAAVRALSRRVGQHEPHKLMLTLNAATRQLHGPLAVVDLSNTEYVLLAALAQAHNRCLEHWQLIELSGKTPETMSKGALEAQVVRLRRKLENAGGQSLTLKAIRGTGYQLQVSIEIRKMEPG
ncbi:MAG: response regulator transcription factor [Rhodoferax sp.]|nr:response regulator transcription factor [Rhodoferax sp.]